MILSENEYKKNFENQCLSKLSSIKFDKSGLEREKIKLYKFTNKIARDIPYNLLIEAENSISEHRKNAVNEINKYLDNEILSMELEKGLFEFCLVHVLTKKLQYHYCYPTYLIMLHEICGNLDTNNEDINNQTLKPSILNGKIDPCLVAFLSPEELHPMKWFAVMQRKAREDRALLCIATYKDEENPCKNCSGTEFHSYEQQLRSADEPASKFIVCTDCGNTVIL
jgi:DNA-directed RNA polymerase subunit M/transcription elongation factor TFIIS